MKLASLKPDLIESISLLKMRDYSGNKGPKVWVEPYGCSASMADSEMICGLLKGSGYGIAASERDAQLSIIVTCSVKDATEHRMTSRIRALSNAGKPLVVAGCLPKADRAKVEALSPSSSLLGPHSIDRVVDVTRLSLLGQKVVALEDSTSDKINIPRVRLNPVVSVVEIASGCMSECTFCHTKLAKGRLRSYRTGDIVRQVRSDVDSGCKQVWLTSTDNGCYGRDIGSSLVELLKACCSVEGDFKIRVGMMNPMYLPEMLHDLAELFVENNKLFKFLHIPVESGSDRILRKMKRGHTSRTFRDAVRVFRQKVPEMTISTDVIVGFPSESEEDFEATLALIAETEPDIVNLSRYSARPGTESAKWKDSRISSQVAKRRSERAHKLAKKIAAKRNSLWQGWQGEIIVDEIGKTDLVQGRNYAYKSVMLSSEKNVKRGCDTDSIWLGEILRAKVYDFSNFSLKAEIIID